MVMCRVIALEGWVWCVDFFPTNHNPASFMINFRFFHLSSGKSCREHTNGNFRLGRLYILFIANAMEDNSMRGYMRGISTTCV